jgi:hypothetical protein
MPHCQITTQCPPSSCPFPSELRSLMISYFWSVSPTIHPLLSPSVTSDFACWPLRQLTTPAYFLATKQLLADDLVKFKLIVHNYKHGCVVRGELNQCRRTSYQPLKQLLGGESKWRERSGWGLKKDCRGVDVGGGITSSEIRSPRM